jgi:cell division protease FtsH
LRLSRVLLLLIVIVGVIALAIHFMGPSENVHEVTLNTVVEQANNDNVAKITQKGESLRINLKEAVVVTNVDGEETEEPVDEMKSSFSGSTLELRQYLEESGVPPEIIATIDMRFEKDSGFDWGMLFIQLLPVIVLIGLFIFLFRGARGQTRQAFDFGRSKVRLADGNKPTVTFADVAGADESKEELQEIVEFLKNPGKFIAIGARIPRGVLIVGAPGTGKTLLARAIAGEAAVPFFSISGSEFVEMFVGVGASRVRDLFDQAKRAAPCIVFVDEIDAVGRHRGAGLGGGHDEREQTLNQLLVEMDGFDSSTNVIVLSATNRPDILDPALLRPGRFDRQVVMDRPDIKGRKAILEVHSKTKPLADDVDLEVVAKATPGFTGADLANLLNEAALLAARRDKKSVEMADLEESIDRVIAGPEKKSRIISQKEKEITAYHESGHALVAWTLPNADPVHKVSIIARGMMGGYTRMLPTEDRHLWSRSQFNDMIAVALAGHAAEQLIFDEMTTGASNDIAQATKMVQRMIMEYGMSEKLGPIAFGNREEMVFLGREIHEQRNYSDETAREIDQEVRAFVDRAYEVTRDILIKGKEKLTELASRLMEQETIEGEDLDKIFADLATDTSE